MKRYRGILVARGILQGLSLFCRNLCAFCFRIVFFVIFSFLGVLKGHPIEKNATRICLAQTAKIGDIVIFSSFLSVVRKLFPTSEITLVVAPQVGNLVELCPYVDEILYFDRDKYRWNLFYRLRFLSQLRRRNFDTAFNCSFSRGIFLDEIVLLSGAKQTVAFYGEPIYLTSLLWRLNNLLYDRVIKTNSRVEIERYRELAIALGAKPDMEMNSEVWISDDDRKYVGALLKGEMLTQKDIVVIAPCASEPLKRWPKEHFITLCDLLGKQDMFLVFCGSGEEKDYIDKIVENISCYAMNWAGALTLRQVAALMENATLYLGNDTGLLHLAIAVGLPSVAVVGGGEFGRFFPYGNTAPSIAFHQLDCYGCRWHCIYDEPYCITDISPQEVYHNVVRLLEHRACKTGNG